MAWSMRSARVDLPWSMCAMMQKLRSWDDGVAAGATVAACSGVGIGDTSAFRDLVVGRRAAAAEHPGQCPTKRRRRPRPRP